MKRLAFTLIFIFFLLPTHAASDLDKRLVIRGEITPNTVTELKIRLESLVPLEELEFVDSRGAPQYATKIIKEFGNIIIEKKLKTFARGRCASACAVLFLLGQHPTFLVSDSKMPTHLMIHAGFHAKTNEIAYGDTDAEFKKIELVTGGKIPVSFLEKVFDAKNPNGGIFIFKDPFLTISGRKRILFCKGDEKFLPRTCDEISTYTFEKLGIAVVE